MLRHSTLKYLLVTTFLLAGTNVIAQELEPRRWAHVPVGANFVGVGYSYTDADVNFDPVLLVEDATMELHSFGVSYVRAFDLFGKTGRVDLLVPYASGRWEGLLDGEFAFTERDGWADPKVRFAVNLVGPPAQRGKDFVPFQPGTIVGASVEVSVPLGEYDSSKLINLGTNRWSIRPQFGVVHSWKKWTAELSASAWYFTDNDDLLGSTLELDPLVAVQGHLIYTFRPGLWVSASAGYGNGARATVAGVTKNNLEANAVWALSLGLPINRQHGLKFVYMAGNATREAGIDFNRFGIGYSYFWMGRKEQ